MSSQDDTNHNNDQPYSNLKPETGIRVDNTSAEDLEPFMFGKKIITCKLCIRLLPKRYCKRHSPKSSIKQTKYYTEEYVRQQTARAELNARINELERVTDMDGFDTAIYTKQRRYGYNDHSQFIDVPVTKDERLNELQQALKDLDQHNEN